MKINEKTAHYGYKVLVTELSKEQWEIIAHSLALHHDEIEVKETQKEVEKILSNLQNHRIFGDAKFWNEE
jgi:predicted ATP-dependent serine protease